MARKYPRAWRVTVDTIRFTGLDVAFDVEKSIRREPNKATIRVWNLSQDHRRQLEQLSTTRKTGPGRIRCELEAGHVGNMAVIFRGDLRTARSEQEGDGSWVTTLEGEDGGRAVLWARVNRSFPPGTRVDQVIRACAEAMGVGVGNLEDAIRNVGLEGGGRTFPGGTVLSGPAPDELDGVLRSVGLTWSVQNGVLQLLRRGQALQASAVVLGAGTGLVGAPVRAADGTVKVRCLLDPDVYPGRQLRLDSDNVRGFYRARKVKYTGDTSADTWYCEAECLELVPRS